MARLQLHKDLIETEIMAFFTLDQMKLLGEVSSSLSSISHWGLYMDWLFPLIQSKLQQLGEVLLKNCNIRNPETASLLVEKGGQLLWIAQVAMGCHHHALAAAWLQMRSSEAWNPSKVSRSRASPWDKVGTSVSPGWSLEVGPQGRNRSMNLPNLDMWALKWHIQRQWVELHYLHTNWWSGTYGST